MFVEDAAQHRITAGPAFPRPATGGGETPVGNLQDLIDLVERAEQRMVHRDIDNPVLGQHLTDLVLEVLPLVHVPEVVDHEEATSQ